MNKLVASVGLVALGTTGVNNVMAQTSEVITSPDQTKPWTVSATLRGFYDSNPSTWPSSEPVPAGYTKESWGYEVSPALGFAINKQATILSFGYRFSYLYYENEPINTTDHSDLNHTFNAVLDHTFSERYHIRVGDSFVMGQEPDMLRAGNSFATFQRVDGDNKRNFGTIDFDAQLTKLFGMQVGYANAWYSYEDDVYASTLDRLEHNIHLDGRWTLSPETVGLVGYAFAETDYTADDFLGTDVDGDLIYSDTRNVRAHYMYLGADHTFNPDLVGSLRAGARYSDYYNDDQTSWSPFVRGSARWKYGPQDFIDFGFSYDRSATDIALYQDTLTLDANTATVFGSINHYFTPALLGTVLGQFQNQTFNGGTADGQSEQIYLAGVQLQYFFNPYFSGQVGYNFDRFDSDLGRSFTRNRVYMGVTARY